MSHFEEAAKRALEMADVQSFLSKYFEAKRLEWQAGGKPLVDVLNEEGDECTRRLLSRIVKGVLAHISDSTGIRVDLPSDQTLRIEVVLDCIGQLAGEISSGDYLLSWFATTGVDRGRHLLSQSTDESPETLYRKLRLADLLEGALDGAEEEGKDALDVWVIEAMEQYYAALANDAVPTQRLVVQGPSLEVSEALVWDSAKAVVFPEGPEQSTFFDTGSGVYPDLSPMATDTQLATAA